MSNIRFDKQQSRLRPVTIGVSVAVSLLAMLFGHVQCERSMVVHTPMKTSVSLAITAPVFSDESGGPYVQENQLAEPAPLPSSGVPLQSPDIKSSMVSINTAQRTASEWVETVNGREQSGVPCYEANKLTKTDLLQLIQFGNKEWRDNCNYTQHIEFHEVRILTPEEFSFLAEAGLLRTHFNTSSLAQYSLSGTWPSSELEKLVTQEFYGNSALVLYIVLSDAGSSAAATLASREDRRIDKTGISKYQKGEESCTHLLSNLTDEQRTAICKGR